MEYVYSSMSGAACPMITNARPHAHLVTVRLPGRGWVGRDWAMQLRSRAVVICGCRTSVLPLPASHFH